jgi:hypothetical protein
MSLFLGILLFVAWGSFIVVLLCTFIFITIHECQSCGKFGPQVEYYGYAGVPYCVSCSKIEGY